MDTLDSSKTTFMSNQGNYYYNVMPFSLKNIGSTYHRLMDDVFTHQIGKKLEIYVDAIMIKTEEAHNHADDLDDILQSVRKYDIRLNPAKISFEMQIGKFLGFMLKRRGIKSNPNKFQTFIDMRRPINVKDVQQLTGRLTAVSRFLFCEGDKDFLFFASLRKKEKFEWTIECEEYFTKIKEFLT